MLGDIISASACGNWQSDVTSAVHASLSKCWSLSWLVLFLLVTKHYLCIPFWAPHIHHSDVLERFCTLFSVYNVNLKCKSNLRGANTVFQPYHSEIFVPDHHSSLFSFIFVFRELDCILMLMSDWVFCFLIFPRICVCSFEIFSFRWNAIFFSICKYSFIVSLVDLTGKCWNVKCIRASYSKN